MTTFAVSLYGSNFHLILSAIGLCLLSIAITRLDPEGVTLVCESLGQAAGSWRYSPAEISPLRPCTLLGHGKLASVLWIECRSEATPLESASCQRMLVFPDAMSFEQWRLLRRELRLEAHALCKEGG